MTAMAIRSPATSLPEPRLVKVEAAGGRLDQYLADQDFGLTRSRLRQLILEGQVTVNGAAVKPSHKVRSGDLVAVSVPPPRPTSLAAQAIPITVVYQDEHLVVVDKPAGLTVHPGPGHPDRTLVNALLAMCPDIEGVGGEIRPGIVHRLDKDTSGLMVAAKNQQAHHSLSAQIKDRKVTKGYLALVDGTPGQPDGRIDAPVGRHPRHRTRMAVVVGGREARTSYRVLETLAGASLLELYLETGRTHQIRVHLAYLGHPLIGDSVYGKRSPLLGRHFLHAHHLGFRHPVSDEDLELRSPLPEDLAGALETFRSG